MLHEFSKDAQAPADVPTACENGGVPLAVEVKVYDAVSDAWVVNSLDVEAGLLTFKSLAAENANGGSLRGAISARARCGGTSPCCCTATGRPSLTCMAQ